VQGSGNFSNNIDPTGAASEVIEQGVNRLVSELLAGFVAKMIVQLVPNHQRFFFGARFLKSVRNVTQAHAFR
jgi:hypothetical protein